MLCFFQEVRRMYLSTILIIISLLIWGIICAAVVYLFILLVKALKKYLRTKPVREEKQKVCQTLGEMIKQNRTRCKMTQEFVAESLGVSRQAVSKWENGTSDPSTSNLIALAKLFQIDASEMLKEFGTD